MTAPIIASKNSQTESSNVETITLTAPSGISDGDVILIVIAVDGNPTAFVNQSGGGAWVQISPTNGDKAPLDRATLYAIYKIASSESGDYITTWTGVQMAQGFIYRITGAISGDEVQNPDNPNPRTSSVSIAPRFTTDTLDTLALGLHAIDRDRITNGQADGGLGWTTEDIIESGGANGCACGVSRKTIPAKSTTFDSTQALSTSDESVSREIGIRSISPVPSVDNEPEQVAVIA